MGKKEHFTATARHLKTSYPDAFVTTSHLQDLDWALDGGGGDFPC